MRHNILKTRRTKLENKLKAELALEKPNIEVILTYVDEYEKDNLEKIDKLSKERSYEAKKIIGGLRQTINAHGPITKVLIGSATKRILGAVIINKPMKPDNKIFKIVKAIIRFFRKPLSATQLLKKLQHTNIVDNKILNKNGKN